MKLQSSYRSAPEGDIAVATDAPTVRVGVVLPEDHRSHVRLRLPPGTRFNVVADGRRLSVQPDSECLLRVEMGPRIASGRLELVLDSDPGMTLSGTSISIAPERKQVLAPGAGITLLKTTVGRSFHWMKEIDVTLAGSVSVYPLDGFLLLVNETDLETYIAGVVTSEMSSDCPASFLQAQAIAARSWLLSHPNGKHGPLFSHCTDDCCQRYQGTGFLQEQALQAIVGTRGKVLVDGTGAILHAQYSKCCGGLFTSPAPTGGRGRRGALQEFGSQVNPSWLRLSSRGHGKARLDAWPESGESIRLPANERDARNWILGPDSRSIKFPCGPGALPSDVLVRFLGGVDSNGDYFRWNRTLSQEAITVALRNNGLTDIGSVTAIQPVKRNQTGRITLLRIHYLDKRRRRRTRMYRGEYAIRKSLASDFLLSSAFLVEGTAGAHGGIDEFRLAGAGWGHGMGLCQMGALGMALAGASCEEILGHYYPDAGLTRMAWAPGE